MEKLLILKETKKGSRKMNETALSKYYDFYAIDEYYCEDDEVLPRPHKVIGKPCGAKIYKKHIYFHCRSMLR